MHGENPKLTPCVQVAKLA